MTPAHVLQGHREAILARRKEVQKATFERTRRYNQAVWGAANTNPLGPRHEILAILLEDDAFLVGAYRRTPNGWPHGQLIYGVY